MSREQLPDDQGLRELLAERALGGLDASERAVLSSVQDLDAAELEFAEAMAAVELANGGGLEPVPAGLRTKLDAAAEAFVAGQAPAASRSDRQPDQQAARRTGTAASPQRTTDFFRVGGWVAAAACLVFVFVTRVSPISGVAPGPTLATQFASFGDQHADASTFEWYPWVLEGEGPEVREVTGSVVWSESAQEGFMRFSGLPENDPEKLQYQLWIVDSRGLTDDDGQSARISGGVFNADDAYFDPASGDYIVPIRARLQVQGAAAFAVTIEQPGGTWVSDMSRRVVWTIAG